MPAEIPIGTSNEITVTVTKEMSPSHLADVAVLSTPAMIELMEQCALQKMRSYLSDEETSVGTEVCVTHDAALSVGQEATIKARLREMEGRRYVWEVEAFGPDGKRLGGGTHKRAVVNLARLRGR
jgi:fluoroacetyl-CoA thioesterase